MVEQEAFNLLVEGSNPSRPTIFPVTPSRLPSSSQNGPHPSLESVVQCHLDTTWQQPIRAHSALAFERLEHSIDPVQALILDSGCGTGESTRLLAERHPECQVLGIDRSAHRLARAPAMPSNARLVRADLSDFWRLARRAGWHLQAHWLLYPNPWPKPAHLRRRWHGHPVFPDLLALGGRLELRSNFALYVEEFAHALSVSGKSTAEVVSFHPRQAASPFEAKYAASGHGLFKLSVQLEKDR